MPKVLTHKLRVQYRGEVFKYVVAHYGAWQTLGHKARGSRGVPKKSKKNHRW